MDSRIPNQLSQRFVCRLGRFDYVVCGRSLQVFEEPLVRQFKAVQLEGIVLSPMNSLSERPEDIDVPCLWQDGLV